MSGPVVFMIHIFHPGEKHCLDHSGFCGCKPKMVNVCPCCNGAGVVEPECLVYAPVLIHRHKGKLVYGTNESPVEH